MERWSFQQGTDRASEFHTVKAPVRRLPFAEFKLSRFFREGQAETWRACKRGS
jgi:hypothetical protein